MDKKEAFTLERRAFLLKAGLGLGGLTLAQILGADAEAQQPRARDFRGVLGTGHVAPRAKRVISIHQFGAVSQVDSFDYKPTLEKLHGQEIPASVRKNLRLSSMVQGQSSFPLVKPLAKFRPGGKSGYMVSDLFPYTREIVDDLCFIRTMVTDQVNHEPAVKFLHTGFQLTGRPAVGAWVSYALGTDNANLPSYVVLLSVSSPAGQAHDAAAWGSGFLPSEYQGVPLRSGNDPVYYVNNPAGVDPKSRRAMLDSVAKLAQAQYQVSQDPEILSTLTQYEMAYRMQQSAPEIADISDEPQYILDMYGPDVQRPGTFARNCLIARRLAERDVKFIAMHNIGWDHHTNIAQRHPNDCRSVDQPSAALVRDLEQRGLLEDTLVVWGSEFGRTPFAQGQIDFNMGRDHHGNNFTWWMAGAGVKPGHVYGETDEFSCNVVDKPVTVHDFHATMLHILGIDHERLRFSFQGRNFRLTDVHGRLLTDILA